MTPRWEASITVGHTVGEHTVMWGYTVDCRLHTQGFPIGPIEAYYGGTPGIVGLPGTGTVGLQRHRETVLKDTEYLAHHSPVFQIPSHSCYFLLTLAAAFLTNV